MSSEAKGIIKMGAIGDRVRRSFGETLFSTDKIKAFFLRIISIRPAGYLARGKGMAMDIIASFPKSLLGEIFASGVIIKKW